MIPPRFDGAPGSCTSRTGRYRVKNTGHVEPSLRTHPLKSVRVIELGLVNAGEEASRIVTGATPPLTRSCGRAIDIV